MTHDDLVARAEKWLKKTVGCGVVFNDSFRSNTPTGECPDGLGFIQETSILVECKASRADFLADKKKRFRKNPEQGMGDWRFFMCEPGVITVNDLPEGWGLLWVTEKIVKKVHGFPKNRYWLNSPFKGNKQAELCTMYSALRRVTIHGHFDVIYESPFKDQEVA